MSVYKTREKGSWRYEFVIDGAKYSKAGYPNKRDALAAQEAAKARIKASPPPSPNSTFLTAANDYLQHLAESGRTPAYIKDVRWRLASQFEKWYPLPLESITKEDIREHLGRRFLEVSGRSANADLALIRSIYNLQVEKDRIGYNPTAGLKAKPEKTKKEYVPPLSDFNEVLLASTGPLRMLLDTLFETAGRPAEIKHLRREDLHLQENYLAVRNSKTGGRGERERIIPITPQFGKRLVRYLRTVPTESAWLFPNLLDANRKYENPQIDWRKPLRHAFDAVNRVRQEQRSKRRALPAPEIRTFGLGAIRPLKASELRKAGWPLMAIQLFLGHTDTGTTERYIHPELCLDLLRPLLKRNAKA